MYGGTYAEVVMQSYEEEVFAEVELSRKYEESGCMW